MKVTVTCCRCKAEVEGIHTVDITGGFYEVAYGSWSAFADVGEKIVCDQCMWADPRYIAVFGRNTNAGNLGNQGDAPDRLC